MKLFSRSILQRRSRVHERMRFWGFKHLRGMQTLHLPALNLTDDPSTCVILQAAIVPFFFNWNVLINFNKVRTLWVCGAWIEAPSNVSTRKRIGTQCRSVLRVKSFGQLSWQRIASYHGNSGYVLWSVLLIDGMILLRRRTLQFKVHLFTGAVLRQ